MPTNLEQGLDRHNSGEVSHTAARLPVGLVYSETTSSRIQAMAREAQLKRWSRAKKEARISADTSTFAAAFPLAALSRTCTAKASKCHGDLPRLAWHLFVGSTAFIAA